MAARFQCVTKLVPSKYDSPAFREAPQSCRVVGVIDVVLRFNDVASDRDSRVTDNLNLQGVQRHCSHDVRVSKGGKQFLLKSREAVRLFVI
jgi:hypothetical protein